VWKPTDFFTTNFGLSYSVQTEYQNSPEGDGLDLSAAVPYLNNTLQNCTVEQIRVQMERHDPCTGAHCSWLTWGLTTVTASASCHVPAALPAYNLNVTTKYNFMPGDYTAFAKIDPMNQGSLWWGAQLLEMWFQALRIQMAHLPPPFPEGYDWLDVSLWFDTSKEITDLDFISYVGSFASNGLFSWIGVNETKPLSYWNDTANNVQPYLPLEINGFAKALYSTVLTDLGQQNGANILTDSDDLQDSLIDAVKALDSYGIVIAWPPSIPGSLQSYDEVTKNSHVGPLGAKPAQIYNQYVCQVPTIKSSGSLIWSVIIGDLVLLGAVWAIFIWCVDLYLKRKDPHAMICEGCLDKYGSLIRGKLLDDRCEAASNDHYG
jgi:hypothetical protein